MEFFIKRIFSLQKYAMIIKLSLCQYAVLYNSPTFPDRKEEPKGNCAKINVLQRVFFFTGFSKRDYSYLEFVFPFKGSEELMHINVNMKYNVKQMLLYVISLRDTAGENKTFCKLYVMFFFKCENAFYFKTFHYLY